MKSRLTIFLALLTISACTSTVFAQGVYSGTGTNGLFGYRVIGGSPRGVAAPGMFGNRFVGPPMNVYGFNTLSAAGAASGYNGSGPYSTTFRPPLNIAAPAPASDLENLTEPQLPMMAEPPFMPDAFLPSPLPDPSATETNGANGTNGSGGTPDVVPAAQSPVSPSGIAAPTAMNVNYPRGWSFVFGSSRPPQGAAALSPEISNRITRLARDRDMLAGRSIEIFLNGETAVMEGAVRNAGDRNVLANVLSLEPRIRYIDNRLTIDDGTANSRNTRSASRR